jgi:hypothetical protein
MEEIYDDMVNVHRAADPAIYAHMMEVMARYRLVYDKASYRIYEQIASPAKLNK